MKKVILGLLVALTSCHSSTTVEVNEDSILTKYSIDTVAKVNDSIKVVDTIKK
jgi:hypothetical protein